MVRYYKGEFRDERTEFERITRQFVGNDPQAVQDQLSYFIMLGRKSLETQCGETCKILAVGK